MTTTVNEHSSTFAPDDIADLVSRGLMGESGNGSRKLHRRILHLTADREYRDMHLDAKLEDNPKFRGLDIFVEVPEHLISKAALLYVGYTEDKAEELWRRWCNWPADGPSREVDAVSGSLYVTFADFITAHVGTSDMLPDNTWDDNTEQWVQCLKPYGLNDDTITAIMDRRFGNIRRTEICAFWARDTLAMRYAGIEEIWRESNNRA